MPFVPRRVLRDFITRRKGGGRAEPVSNASSICDEPLEAFGPRSGGGGAVSPFQSFPSGDEPKGIGTRSGDGGSVEIRSLRGCVEYSAS